MIVSLALGLLILRLVAGLTIAAHGAQKLFGWFEGPGLNKLAKGFQNQGFKPALFWVFLVILGEFGGGLSVAFGFLTPLGAAGIFGAMFMAIFKSHWKNGFWNSKRGLEFPLSLLAISVAIGLIGPGSYSLDALFGIALPEAFLYTGRSCSSRRYYRTHYQPSSRGCAGRGQVIRLVVSRLLKTLLVNQRA